MGKALDKLNIGIDGSRGLIVLQLEGPPSYTWELTRHGAIELAEFLTRMAAQLPERKLD